MHQMDLEDYYPNAPGYKGGETSKAAAKKIKAAAKTQKERVLAVLEASNRALTAEIISKLSGVNLHSTRSRLSELQVEGIAEQKGVGKGQHTKIVTWGLV